MKEELINKAYEIAKERYAAVGVDTEKVMETMQNFHLSLHCWQADDVTGFEVQAGSLTGGIQATGNYPGKARNIDELRADILKAASYIPGTHRLNLHEIYGDFQGKVVDQMCIRDRFYFADSGHLTDFIVYIFGDIDGDITSVTFGPSFLPQISGYFGYFIHLFGQFRAIV